MAIKALTIRAPQTKHEMRQAHDLMASAYAEGAYALPYWRDGYSQRYPSSTHEYTRVAFAGNELAGVVRITSETMRLGEARLKTGNLGAGPVSARRKDIGAARLLLENALTYLRQRQYHACVLFGEPRLHYPLGFTSVFPEHHIIVEMHDAVSGLTPGHQVRSAKPGDIAAVQRIHTANNNNADGAFVRNGAHFTNKWTQPAMIQVLTTEQGRVVGYFIPGERAGRFLDIEEAGIAEEAVGNSLICACGHIADEANATALRFHLPPRHPFARYLRQFPSVHETHHCGEGGGMMTLVDVSETLESMIPEFESRLASSHLAESRIECTLYIDGNPYRIRAHRGVVDVAAMPGRGRIGIPLRGFIQMLTGYRTPDEVIASGSGVATADARTFLSVLFPERFPYLWRFDRF